MPYLKKVIECCKNCQEIERKIELGDHADTSNSNR